MERERTSRPWRCREGEIQEFRLLTSRKLYSVTADSLLGIISEFSLVPRLESTSRLNGARRCPELDVVCLLSRQVRNRAELPGSKSPILRNSTCWSRP